MQSTLKIRSLFNTATSSVISAQRACRHAVSVTGGADLPVAGQALPPGSGSGSGSSTSSLIPYYLWTQKAPQMHRQALQLGLTVLCQCFARVRVIFRKSLPFSAARQRFSSQNPVGPAAELGSEARVPGLPKGAFLARDSGNGRDGSPERNHYSRPRGRE